MRGFVDQSSPAQQRLGGGEVTPHRERNYPQGLIGLEQELKASVGVWKRFGKESQRANLRSSSQMQRWKVSARVIAMDL